jgi:hypothetical protein
MTRQGAKGIEAMPVARLGNARRFRV